MIYDMMQILDCPIETICVGSAFDEGALLLASGTPGMRFATPNATICISQVIKNEYYRANLEDAKTVLQRMQRDNKNFISALANKTGKKVIDLTKDLEIKKFLTSKQAQTYGIIDKVIGVK
jgi:ATP-dependent Clp protease protease subunit